MKSVFWQKNFPFDAIESIALLEVFFFVLFIYIRPVPFPVLDLK